ncbi:MAG TPA: hypothetical protein VKR31_02430 [Rhizomicrobium sp.]|nr:hypothetical protein [Rhizomicrobium sp.]
MRWPIAAAAATLVLPPGSPPMEMVTVNLHKDSCAKFQQSGAVVQKIYLMMASSHIKRTFSIRFTSEELSQPMLTYCAANPTTILENAADAVEAQLSAPENSN